MSNTAAQPIFDLDFWEFVGCGRCQLPFALGATIPFWLTECGHVICNNHLNADQSCNQCGVPGVHLVPLQHELDAPMSEWFRSVPIALDNIAQAAKFQQETLASQIRYYKSRHQQQRALIDRLKREAAEVKKANEALDNENHQLRQLLGGPQHSGPGYCTQQPSDTANSNGKRPMVDGRSRPQTSSSPLSTFTPVGPNRLTLPPGQIAPNLVRNKREEQRPPPGNGHQDNRPTTQRRAGDLTEQYSFVPPSTPQFHPPQLTHTQAAPRLFQRTRPNPEQQHHTQAPQAPTPHGQRTAPPPVKFKPAKMNSVSYNKPNPFDPNTQAHAHQPGQQGEMGPPPTPLHVRRMQPADTAMHIINTNLISTSGPLQGHTVNIHPRTSRFVPPDQPPAFPRQNLVQSQPPTPSLSALQRFLPSNARAPSRTAAFNMSGGSQRIPFIPGAR